MNCTDLLRDQHREVRELFELIQATAEPDERHVLRARLTLAIRSHSSIEEELFYPRLEQSEELAELVAESFRDHEQIKLALTRVERCSVSDEEFGECVEQLAHLVLTHASEEEAELLPRVDEHWPRNFLERTGAEMERRYAELQQGGHEIYV